MGNQQKLVTKSIETLKKEGGKKGLRKDNPPLQVTTNFSYTHAYIYMRIAEHD